MSSWSAELRLKTRKILDGIDPFPKEGILRMKNIHNFSAYLKHSDLCNGQIILYDMETQLATPFQTTGDMFDAGWIADLQEISQLSVLMNTKKVVTENEKLPASANNLSTHRVPPEPTKVVPLPSPTKERA